MFDPFGTYNGYKFLFSEMSVEVESDEVTPGNLSSSLKWDVITKKIISASLNHYVKGVFYKTVKAASDLLSDLFSAYEPALSISYGPSKGYIKARVSGDLYVKTILIRDDLNRVEGHAYYEWGTTERLAAVVRVSAKYPYKENPGGTYEYRYPSESSSVQQSYAPGYFGNATIYQSIIKLYNNKIGYFTHDELINVDEIVADLLN